MLFAVCVCTCVSVCVEKPLTAIIDTQCELQKQNLIDSIKLFLTEFYITSFPHKYVSGF